MRSEIPLSRAARSARHPHASLGNQGALDLVGAATDRVKQRIAHAVLEHAVAQRALRALGERGAGAEQVERRLGQARMSQVVTCSDPPWKLWALLVELCSVVALD